MLSTAFKKSTKSLTTMSSRAFSLNWGPDYERPLSDRVMSTNTWPVPYYQRLYKAYPVREKKDKLSLLLSDIDIDDTNWYAAKEYLRQSYRGRQAVEWVENNLATNSYVVIQKDVGKMARAYVDDIIGFLNVANKENKKILDKIDLI